MMYIAPGVCSLYNDHISRVGSFDADAFNNFAQQKVGPEALESFTPKETFRARSHLKPATKSVINPLHPTDWEIYTTINPWHNTQILLQILSVNGPSDTFSGLH